MASRNSLILREDAARKKMDALLEKAGIQKPLFAKDRAVREVEELEFFAASLESLVGPIEKPVEEESVQEYEPQPDVPLVFEDVEPVPDHAFPAGEPREPDWASGNGAPTQTVAEEQGTQSETVAEPAPELHAEAEPMTDQLHEMAETSSGAAVTVVEEAKAEVKKASGRGRKAKK